MHPTIAAALRPFMPHSKLERAAYMTGDQTTQMLIARFERLKDAVSVLIHTVETYELDSDEYAEAIATVREML